jgi:hypothetical protein
MADTTKEKILKINTQGAEKNVKSLKTQIRELKEQMAQLEKGTEEYDKAAVQLSNAIQKQTEITEAAKYANKDFGATLSTMTSVAQGVVGAISAVNGAMNLMGIEGEDAEKAMLKVQSLMAIIQGMGAMDTAIKGIKGLGLAFSGLAKSIGTSTKALGIWGIAIAAISAAVIALVDHFKNLKEEAKVTLTELDEKMISANASAQEAVGTYMLLKNSFVAAKEKGESLTKWVKDHTTELKALNMQNMTMSQYEDAFINRTGEYITALTNRYKAEWQLKAVQDKYIENLKDISRWHDLAYKIGINDYMHHWDDEYTIDGITRTVEEWQKASMNAFTENLHIDDEINEVVNGLEEANNKLKEFGVTAGDTGNTTKKTLKELIRLFTELRNKVIELDLSFDQIATTNDSILKNEEIFVNKFKAIVEKSGISDAIQKQFLDIINGGNVPLPDNFTSYNLPIDAIFKQEDLDNLNTQLENERKKLGDIVNGTLPATEKEYNSQKEIVAELEKQLSIRTDIYKAYKEFLRSYENEMRTIDKINEKEEDYNNLVETTITYYSELRANNPFADTNKTITESQYQIDKLNKLLGVYDEELDKLANEPVTQESAEREYELLQARKDAETQIFNLQTTLENAYYEQRRIDIEALMDEQEKKAKEQNWQNEEYNLDRGQTDNYNTELQALQVQLQMLENQKSAVEQYYTDLMGTVEEFSEQWVMLEIEKNAAIEELDRQHAEKSVQLEQEKSKRRLTIAKTYISAYSAISSQISGILSAEMEKYSDNKEKYKKLKYAQGVITTAEGAISAFMSGFESGIPWPGNLILAGALSGLAIAAGHIQLQNIKNEKLENGTQSNVNTGSFGEYDTLSYAQNSEILGNIQDSRVYVVESDITSTQNRVQVAETQATF